MGVKVENTEFAVGELCPSSKTYILAVDLTLGNQRARKCQLVPVPRRLTRGNGALKTLLA